MKKEEIYLEVKNKKEAKALKQILLAFGQEIKPQYWLNDKPSHDQIELVFEDGWMVAINWKEHKKLIDIKQLVKILSEEQPKKIAVRVENEKEFHALMKYYDSLGWNHAGLDRPFSLKDFEYGTCFTFHDKWFSVKDDDVEYQIIPFSDFAKDKGIKLPLILSEDKVWLYEGDEYLSIWKGTDGNWNLDDEVYKTFKNNDRIFIDEPNEFKAFSTKQSALDWIEAQKPKLPEYVVLEKTELDDYTNTVFSTHLEISGDFIGLINTGKILRMDKHEIEQILDAMNNKVRKS